MSGPPTGDALTHDRGRPTGGALTRTAAAVLLRRTAAAALLHTAAEARLLAVARLHGGGLPRATGGATDPPEAWTSSVG